MKSMMKPKLEIDMNIIETDPNRETIVSAPV